MLRRNLLLSPLAFCLPSVLAQAKGKRAVVVYFSWYDNTFQERIRPSDIDETTSASLKAPGQVTLVAHLIGKDLGLPIYPIVVKDRYTTIYEDCLDRVIGEKTERVFPELTGPTDLPEFDLLFLGFPNWSYTIPRAVWSFLSKVPKANKTIAPFCVHGTGGLARTIRDLKSAAPEARLTRTLSIDRSELAESRKRALDWAQKVYFG